MVKLGTKVRDSITGFTGIATAKTTYLNGCIRILVEAGTLENGKPVEDWFDEARLGSSEAKVGGPGKTPPRRDP